MGRGRTARENARRVGRDKVPFYSSTTPTRCPLPRAAKIYVLPRCLSGAQEGVPDASALPHEAAAALPQGWAMHLDASAHAPSFPAPSNSSAAVPLGSASRPQGGGDQWRGAGKGQASEARPTSATAGVRAVPPPQQQHVTYGAPSSEAAIMFAVSSCLLLPNLFRPPLPLCLPLLRTRGRYACSVHLEKSHAHVCLVI